VQFAVGVPQGSDHRLVRLGGVSLLIGQSGSPRGGLLVGEVAQSRERWRLASVVEEGPGELGPGRDAGDGDRSAVAFQGVQDTVDTLDAAETSLLCGFGQVRLLSARIGVLPVSCQPAPTTSPHSWARSASQS